jgi:hypothetical protein
MAEWKRVKDKRTGHEYSVVNVNKEIHEVIGDDENPTVTSKPLPPKPNVSKADGQTAARAGKDPGTAGEVSETKAKGKGQGGNQS